MGFIGVVYFIPTYLVASILAVWIGTTIKKPTNISVFSHLSGYAISIVFSLEIIKIIISKDQLILSIISPIVSPILICSIFMFISLLVPVKLSGVLKDIGVTSLMMTPFIPWIALYIGVI